MFLRCLTLYMFTTVGVVFAAMRGRYSAASPLVVWHHLAKRNLAGCFVIHRDAQFKHSAIVKLTVY